MLSKLLIQSSFGIKCLFVQVETERIISLSRWPTTSPTHCLRSRITIRYAVNGQERLPKMQPCLSAVRATCSLSDTQPYLGLAMHWTFVRYNCTEFEVKLSYSHVLRAFSMYQLVSQLSNILDGVVNDWLSVLISWLNAENSKVSTDY